MNVLDTLKKISPAFAGLLVTSLAAACTPESDESTADLDEDSLGARDSPPHPGELFGGERDRLIAPWS